MAAPVGGQIFSEILPYLEVSQGNTEEIETIETIEMPDIMGKSIKEAETILEENNLELEIKDVEGEIDKENTYVKNQIPQAGITINKRSKVIVEI